VTGDGGGSALELECVGLPTVEGFRTSPSRGPIGTTRGSVPSRGGTAVPRVRPDPVRSSTRSPTGPTTRSHASRSGCGGECRPPPGRFSTRHRRRTVRSRFDATAHGTSILPDAGATPTVFPERRRPTHGSRWIPPAVGSSGGQRPATRGPTRRSHGQSGTDGRLAECPDPIATRHIRPWYPYGRAPGTSELGPSPLSRVV
jgi:hypothetical protein